MIEEMLSDIVYKADRFIYYVLQNSKSNKLDKEAFELFMDLNRKINELDIKVKYK